MVIAAASRAARPSNGERLDRTQLLLQLVGEGERALLRSLNLSQFVEGQNGPSI
jgi:hypothetical protein